MGERDKKGHILVSDEDSTFSAEMMLLIILSTTYISSVVTLLVIDALIDQILELSFSFQRLSPCSCAPTVPVQPILFHRASSYYYGPM